MGKWPESGSILLLRRSSPVLIVDHFSGGPFGLPMGALGGRRRAAQARAATMQTGQLGTVGIGSLVLVMFVVMGAVR